MQYLNDYEISSPFDASSKLSFISDTVWEAWESWERRGSWKNWGLSGIWEIIKGYSLILRPWGLLYVSIWGKGLCTPPQEILIWFFPLFSTFLNPIVRLSWLFTLNFMVSSSWSWYDSSSPEMRIFYWSAIFIGWTVDRYWEGVFERGDGSGWVGIFCFWGVNGIVGMIVFCRGRR